MLPGLGTSDIGLHRFNTGLQVCIETTAVLGASGRADTSLAGGTLA